MTVTVAVSFWQPNVSPRQQISVCDKKPVISELPVGGWWQRGGVCFLLGNLFLKKLPLEGVLLTLLRACCEFYQNYGSEKDFMSWVILVPQVTA